MTVLNPENHGIGKCPHPSVLSHKSSVIASAKAKIQLQDNHEWAVMEITLINYD